jgi:hypothetical protein
MRDDESEHLSPAGWMLVVLAWAAVGVPLLWGVYTTLKKAMPLFE